MSPNEFARHFALLSLLVATSGLYVILGKWGRHHALSLSSHAALRKPSYWLFAGSLIVSGILFYLYTVLWLMPAYNLSGWFGALVAAALLCEVATALIPDNGGRRSRLHGVAAWTMAVLMMFIAIALIFVPGISIVAKFFESILLSYLVLDWFLFLFIKSSRRLFLIFQSTYILCFYLSILAVTYIR